MPQLRVYKEMEPTYGEFAEALKKLNYEDRSYGEHFLFVNEEFGHDILFRLKAEHEKVDKGRFALFSSQMEDFGVIEHQYDLVKMIERARIQRKKEMVAA